MIRTLINHALLLALFIFTFEISANSEESKIMAVRAASNAALKALNEELNMKYMTDNALITASNGTLLKGKAGLRDYIAQFADEKPMYWVRKTEEIIVNSDKGLAWESGIWHAYWYDDQKQEQPLNNGKYSAQWIMTDGK